MVGERRDYLLSYVENHWPKKATKAFDPASVSDVALQALDILSVISGGLHNFSGKVRVHRDDPNRTWTDPFWIEFTVYGDWATWDFKQLTQFVVGCHDACVRGAIHGVAPQYMAVSFSPRKTRDGAIYERHPSIEQAIDDWRKHRVPNA